MLSSTEEIMVRLIDLDTQLKLITKRITPLRFVIFGGSAIMLITNDAARTTMDIDVYMLDQLSDDELHLLEKYDINNRLQGGDEPYDFRDRIDRINYNFECIEVYTADPMDVIMHKLLNRDDKRDLDDILLLLDYVTDFDLLKSIYNESSAVANRHPSRIRKIEEVFEIYYFRKSS